MYIYIMFAIFAWCKTRVLLIGFVEYDHRFIFRRSHSYCYINTGHTRLGTTDSGLEVSGMELVMAPRHYLNQSLLIIQRVLWHSPLSNFKDVVYNMCSDYTFNLITTSPRGQWVNVNITKLQNKTDAYSVAYCVICRQGEADGYHQTSNISRTILGNKTVDHSDVVLQQHLHFLPGFNGLGKDNCKTRREAFKFWYLVRLILEVWRYIHLTSPHRYGHRNTTKRTKTNLYDAHSTLYRPELLDILENTFTDSWLCNFVIFFSN